MSNDPLMEHRLSYMEREVVPKLTTAIEKMTESLQKLTIIDERQAEFREAVGRAFQEIEETNKNTKALDERLRAVEVQLPTLNLIKNWIIAGVIGGTSLFLIAAAVIIFKLPH